MHGNQNEDAAEGRAEMESENEHKQKKGEKEKEEKGYVKNWCLELIGRGGAVIEITKYSDHENFLFVFVFAQQLIFRVIKVFVLITVQGFGGGQDIQILNILHVPFIFYLFIYFCKATHILCS